MVLRVNAAQGSVAAYQLRLAEIGADSTPVGEEGLLLAKPLPVGQLPGFASGAVSVQDASPQMAAHLVWDSPRLMAAVKRGETVRILDACAAPGAHQTGVGARRPAGLHTAGNRDRAALVLA